MARKKTRREPEGIPADLEDEVDVFHKGKEKISLDADGEESDEDMSDEEVDVYNLENNEEEDEEDDDGDDDEEASDSDAEGRLAALKRQERHMRAQLQLQQGAGSDEDDSEEEEQPQGWGARKGAYYEQGEAEDEEALREEEEEADAIQRKAAQELRDEGPDAGSSSSEESDGDVETHVGRSDLSGAKGIVEEEAPELEALLSQLLSSLKEVRSRIGPLVTEVRAGKLATKEGMTYLETKNLLLLQYCMHLVFYLLLKAEGRAVQQHPVIARLVEIRAFLEKIRPIDKKLRYQIDKLLASHQAIQAAAAGDDEAEMDPLQFRPNPSALVSRIEAPKANGDAGDAVYKPPRLNPIAMEEDPDRDYNKRKRRAAENQARKSGRSELMRDLAREVEDAPEELRETRAGEETEAAARQRARLDRRAAEEEELMMRVPLGKKELKGMRAAQRAGLSGGALLDDFADDVADLVKVSDGLGSGGGLSQRFGADLSQAGQSNKASGDADLPTKMPLADRRAKVDNARVKQKRHAAAILDEPDGLDFNGLSDEDNEAYEQARESKKRKRAAKAAKYAAAPTQPPVEEELIAGPRKVTREVDQNRGLTPHRRKDTKNPRVKGRKKFEKATMRRKGQVADVRRQSGAYGGESTGIKARVSKSTRF